MKVGIYCRISSDSQSNNTSIQYQKEEGMKFCLDNGFEYEIYSETISGGEVRREEFDKTQLKLLLTAEGKLSIGKPDTSGRLVVSGDNTPY